MQVIPSAAHGALDYLFGAALGTAPELFGYTDERDFTPVLPRLFAATVVVYSLFTRYEWGVFRVIPFEVHLLFDLILGIKLLGAAWLLDTLTAHPRAIGVLTAFGVTSLILAALSQRHTSDASSLERRTAQ